MIRLFRSFFTLAAFFVACGALACALVPEWREHVASFVGAGAIALGMACPLRGESSNPVLIAQLDSSIAKKNQTVSIDFAKAPVAVVNGRGQIAHVRSIEIRGSVRYTLAATNDRVSPYQVRSLIQNVTLTDVTGWNYLQNIDARQIIDWTYYRHNFRLPWSLLGGYELNMGAGDTDSRIDLEIALTPHRARGHSPDEGILLLSALMDRGPQAFQFFLSDTIAGNPNGFTFSKFMRDDGTEGLDVYADIVYLDDAALDAPWGVRYNAEAQMKFALPNPEAVTQMAVARYMPEDSLGGSHTGQQMAGDIDGITIQLADAGGDPLLAGATKLIAATRDLYLKRGALDSAAQLGLSALDEPTEDAVTRPSLILCPPRPRARARSGRVIVNFNTRPQNSTKYLHHFTMCDDANRSAKLKQSLTTRGAACGPCTVVQVSGTGQLVPGVQDPTATKYLVTNKG